MIDSQKVSNVYIKGLPAQDVSVYKVSPLPRKISQVTLSGSSPYTLTFTDTIAPGDSYIALSASKIKTPLLWGIREFGDLRNTNRQADYLLITHKRFWNTAQSYVSTIGSTYGLTTKVVDIDEIYDHFGYGYPTAESIREFIKSTTRWNSPIPAYLLLGR